MYVGNTFYTKTKITTVVINLKYVQIRRNSNDNVPSKACQFNTFNISLLIIRQYINNKQAI